MATPIYLEHTFPCSARTLYELVSNPSFDAALLDAIEVDSELLEHQETLIGFTAKYRFRPRRSMPTFMKNTVGKSMEWVEERAWNHQELFHRWIIVPGVGGARTEIAGTYRIVPIDDGHSLRRIEGTFNVRAPLVGASIERFIVQQTADAFERGARYIVSHLDNKDENGP